jgi:hypothetical protein
LGKIHQFIKLIYFSADLRNETKSFYTVIDHTIAEVPPGGFCLNRKIHAAGPGERLHHAGMMTHIFGGVGGETGTWREDGWNQTQHHHHSSCI